ncbi:MAG TPA: NAD(P)H-hydrate dehydratase [Acidimicrobiia bacterium]|nr:NAD(P)H-hydrate dehydratase [Acidimicrobiia bacterium]
MKPILTAEEYRRVDQAYTGNLDQAMDRAGFAVAVSAARLGAGYGRRVVVLAGPGNNGGDGYVAARYLKRRGAAVEIHALTEPRTTEAINAAALAQQQRVSMRPLAAVTDADLVIDALFGGGGRGGLAREVLAWMDTPAPVIAVDYPTGIDPSSGNVDERAFRAVETVTFGALKTGHVRGEGPEHCGVVTVADIGIEGGEPSMWLAEESDAPRPGRHRRTHKWSAGAVLVAGGSTGMVGAAVLAARSALHFGAGSVAVSSPRADLVTAAAPELLTMAVEEAEARLDRFDVVIAGPGLSEEDREAVIPIVGKAHRVLLDAGGLDPVMVDAAAEGGADVVVTPHSAEFERVAGVGGGAFSVRAYAGKKGVVVLLKGNPTLISDGSEPILVRTGGPELASIGTGDVLSGMVGALWARGLEPRTAAVSGAYWHGVAGADLATTTTLTSDALARHVGRFAW